MSEDGRYQSIESLGGPFVLMGSDSCRKWAGSSGASYFDDKTNSDYDVIVLEAPFTELVQTDSGSAIITFFSEDLSIWISPAAGDTVVFSTFPEDVGTAFDLVSSTEGSRRNIYNRSSQFLMHPPLVVFDASLDMRRAENYPKAAKLNCCSKEIEFIELIQIFEPISASAIKIHIACS